MEKKRLMLVASGSAAGALSVVETAMEMSAQGKGVDICLMQDGSLCALRANETTAGRAVARALAAGAGVLYLADDLAARGFSVEQAREGTRPLSYGELVDLMLDGGHTTLGAF